MKDLIRSEWRRFRRLALIVAAFHALALLLLSRAFDVLQIGYGDQGMMLAIYMLLGLTLALLQVGSYRATSRWLWLIHRPLAPARIFGSLALSALVIMSVAILAPLLVFLVGTDLFTTHVVDIRHYVTLFHVMAFTLMAWLAGAHASTSRSKVAVAVLLAPLMLALKLASVWWLLLPVSISVLWLLFIARETFRADRDAPIATHRALILTALPLQLGFFLLLFQLAKTSIAVFDLLGQSGPGRTVLSTDTNVDVDAMLRSMSQDFLAKGLDSSDDARAAVWREQIPLLDVVSVTPDIERFPVRNQLGNVSAPWWDDKRSIKWTFSHDRMMYHGRDLQDGASSGWWGTRGSGGEGTFTEVPAVAMTRSILYTIDHESQQQHELVRLPAGEWFTGAPVNALDRVLVQTNRRLIAYRPDREAVSPFAPPQLDWQMPLPQSDPPPLMLVAELLDGWLVSLYYFDSREFDGFETLIEPWQQVAFIDTDGNATVVGERHNIRGSNVTFGASALAPVSSWWVSPPLYALSHVPDLLDTGLTQPPRFDPLPRVPVFYPLAIALMVISLIAGYVWLRGTQVGTARRRLWLASCALIGLPAFLSMICLEPRKTACP